RWLYEITATSICSSSTAWRALRAAENRARARDAHGRLRRATPHRSRKRPWVSQAASFGQRATKQAPIRLARHDPPSELLRGEKFRSRASGAPLTKSQSKQTRQHPPAKLGSWRPLTRSTSRHRKISVLLSSGRARWEEHGSARSRLCPRSHTAEHRLPGPSPCSTTHTSNSPCALLFHTE